MPTDADALSARGRELLVASAATSYPGDELGQLLATPALRAHPGLVGLAAAGGVDALEHAYIERFDRGKDRVSLYETEHGRMRGLGKGHDLADLAGFYRAFGLELDTDEQREMLDHVAVELEFYGVLLLKQAVLTEAGDDEGQAVVEAARKAFLTDHLGRFVSAIAAQPAVAADPVYGPTFAWCAALVADECARLGVTPAPLDFFPGLREPDDVDCGAKVRLPVVE